jgi:hypothetical protein
MRDKASGRFEHAADIWRKAQVVYEGPTRLGIPEPLEAVFDIASGHPNCVDELVNLLRSDSQLVIAYALLTLQAMGCGILENLPQELLDRREKVTIHTGSFQSSMDLGGLARQIQKRARQRRQEASE